jgi:hypothetical protein
MMVCRERRCNPTKRDEFGAGRAGEIASNYLQV